MNSTRAFENEHDRLLEKLRQLREAAKPFVALQHYFEHGYTGGNDPRQRDNRATICARLAEASGCHSGNLIAGRRKKLTGFIRDFRATNSRHYGLGDA